MIDQNRERLEALKDRIDDTEMEAKSPIPVTFNERAGDPTSPASNNAKKLGMVGGALGFGAVFAFFLVFDFLDNRIRRAGDLSKAIGTPSARPIPLVPDGTFADIIREQPRHPASIAVQALAEKLLRDREEFGGRVFGIGSVSAEAGASSLSFNLALSLRQSLDKVLLVEADFRSGGLRKFLNQDIPNESLWFPDGTSSPPAPTKVSSGDIDVLPARVDGGDFPSKKSDGGGHPGVGRRLRCGRRRSWDVLPRIRSPPTSHSGATRWCWWPARTSRSTITSAKVLIFSLTGAFRP